MLTDLEKYLKDKRAELDADTPDDEIIWKGIEGQLPGKVNKTGRPGKKNLMIRIWNIAAVIIILFSLGYVTRDILGSRNIDRKVTLSEINDVLGKREIEYKTLVTLKTDEVRLLTNTDNLVIKELFKEIKTLDVVYDQALRDLKEMGYNEKIVNTIFDTYEKKIHILELIILESNKAGRYENNGKINL